MTRRIDNFRGNHQQFTVLKDELSIAEEKVNLCRTTLEKYSQAIITESMDFEVINVRGMAQTLRHVEDSVDELQKKRPARRRLLGRFSRANRNADAISEQVEAVRDMSSRLNKLNEKLKGIAMTDGTQVTFLASNGLQKSLYRSSTTMVMSLNIPRVMPSISKLFSAWMKTEIRCLSIGRSLRPWEELEL